MSSDFGATRTVKARKPHQCEECQRTIDPGERYEKHAGSWEGNFFTWVSCGHCGDAREFIGRIDYQFWEGGYGGVGEWFAHQLWREYILTFEEGLRSIRLSRQFANGWRDQFGALIPLPAPIRKAAA